MSSFHVELGKEIYPATGVPFAAPDMEICGVNVRSTKDPLDEILTVSLCTASFNPVGRESSSGSNQVYNGFATVELDNGVKAQEI